MKLSTKASLAFKKERSAIKVTFGLNVINSLTTLFADEKNVSLNIADLPVSIAELQELNDTLNNAITKALTGNHSAVAAVKSAVANWNIGFTSTAIFITNTAMGDESFICSAGFVPTKSETQPSQKPGAITNFRATINGSKGAIIAESRTPVYDALTYIFSAIPDGVTISYVGSTMVITVGDKIVYITAAIQKRTELYGLPSGVPYNVSGYVINRAGSGPATDMQKVIPQ